MITNLVFTFFNIFFSLLIFSLHVTTSIYPVPSICSQDQISDWFASLAECLHWNVRKKQKAIDELSDLTRSSSGKVEKILKGSLDLIQSSSLSVKIQIIGGKVCLRCKGKTLLGFVDKLLKTKRLLTSLASIEFSLKVKGDAMESRLSS